MGWVTFKLSYGLRLSTSPDLAANIREHLEDGKEPSLLLVDLSPNLTSTEMGEYESDGPRNEPLTEETYEECKLGEGYSLLMYSHCSQVMDESNGVEINTSRCYSGGHLEFLRGDFDLPSLSDSETKTLQSVAEGLGVPFKLSFSLRTEGSGGVEKMWFRE